MNRQKLIFVIGCGALVLLVLWRFCIEPVRARLRKLPEKIATIEDVLREMQKSRDRCVEIGEEDYSNPLSFLEKLASEAGLNYKLTYKESAEGRMGATTSVKAQLDGITLDELKDYLYKMELCPNLVLSSFRISRGKKNLLRVSFDVSVK